MLREQAPALRGVVIPTIVHVQYESQTIVEHCLAPTAHTAKNPCITDAGIFLRFLLFYDNHAVLFDGDGHAVLDVSEELVAKAIDNGHAHAVYPNVCKHRACGC